MIKKKIILKRSLKTLRIILRLWPILNTDSKRSIKILIFLQILNGILEMLSLFSIIPFIKAITDTNTLYENTYINHAIKILNINNEENLILISTIIFISFILLANKIRIFNLWFTNNIAAKIGNELSGKSYFNNLNQNYENHINKNSSEVIALIGNYIVKTIDFIYSFLQLIAAIIISSLIILSLFLYNWEITITCIFIITIFYYLIINIVKNRLNLNSKLIVNNTNKQIKIVQETLGNIRDIILEGNQDRFLQIFKKTDKIIRLRNAENATIAGFPRFLMEAIGITLIAIIAFILVKMNFDSTFIFSTLGILALGTQRILPAFQLIFYSWSALQSSREPTIRVLDFLENISTKKYLNTKRKFEFNKEIVFKNISFKYQGSHEETLSNINLTIKKGEIIGIMGETGSGKSTFVDLFMGLLIPTKGEIYVDELCINKNLYLNDSWRRKISHLPQNLFILDDTFINNIAFGKFSDEINIKRVKESAKKALLKSKIESLPKNYETIIGEKGGKLSGGQKQRLGLARAIFRNKEILVLDEATSALDLKTETLIMKNIKSISQNNTVIIISHRLSTLDFCDKIYEVKNKKLKLLKKDE